jgi:ribonuclease P protein component
LIYETTISTLKNPTQTPAWIFESQFQQKRARHPAQPPAGRAQALDSHIILLMGGETPKRLRFGRGARIKQGRDFARVRRQGERITTGCLIANWQSTSGRSRLGVVTARRLGNAVVRNRARRLLRESFRLHQHELAGSVDLVLVARSSIVGKPLAAVEKDFLTTLRKAGLLK